MKVIFSRKGFDSSYGGFPSIILPKEMGRKMISFPIPEANPKCEVIEANKLFYSLDDGRVLSLEEIFEQLKIIDSINIPEFSQNGEKVAPRRKGIKEQIIDGIKYKTVFHYDPEVPKIGYDYAAFGQSGAAASHLLSKGIDHGDVFLFFGTFLKTFLNNENKISYDTRMHEIQAIWGYMIVDDVFHIKPDADDILIKEGDKYRELSDNIEPLSKYKNLKEHPHYVNRDRKYTEKADNIIICGKQFGTFSFEPKYQLTKVGYKKSYWELQDFLKGANISYCGVVNDPSCFKSADIGQEFVAEGFKEEEMKNWLKDLGIIDLEIKR